MGTQRCGASVRARTALCLLAVAAGPVAGQRVQRGAVVGGTVGAVAVGLFGALVSRGVCDAADCSDAWIEGVVPGTVFGGLAGGAVGGALGAITGHDAARPNAPHPVVFVGRAGGAGARLDSDYQDQGATGLRAMAGIRTGGLSVGPAFERLTARGWRATNVSLETRLESRTGLARPFGTLGVGKFDWRFPGPPTGPVTQTDDYWGLNLGVGAALGRPGQSWAITTEVRFHHAGGRPAGPGSTTHRQIRQINLGLELAL
ncbi:MAG: hypothetical protein ACKVZ0_19460 [Gemmatimonadales bacterium]